MNRILAIATITMRNAVRSRVVISLLCGLVLIVLGLPLTIRGDGTIAGLVAIHLRYTLGCSILLLSIVTVWAGCGAISTEIHSRQMHLVVTKPIRSYQIWLGKWVGLMILNVLFLGFSALSAYGMLWWTTRPAILSQEERQELQDEILIAHRYLSPLDADVRDAARRQFEGMAARGELPGEIPPDEVLRILEEQIRHQAHSVREGQSRRWIFRLPHAPPEQRPLFLQYRFSSSRIGLEPVPGRWRAAPADGDGIMVEHMEASPRTTYTVEISPDRVDDDGYLIVEYTNESPTPVTVIFPPDEGIQLLIYAGRFEMNYVRGLLVILTQLAFLSAVGVTAGALFSFPVAALASFYMVMLLNAGRIVAGMAERDLFFARPDIVSPGLAFVDAVLRIFYRGLHAMLQPLQMANPLDLLAMGRLIPWTEVGYAMLTRIVLYGGALALLGAWHLRHREVGLPTE